MASRSWSATTRSRSLVASCCRSPRKSLPLRRNREAALSRRAASEIGLQTVVIPRANMKDVLLEDRYQGKIEIIPVDTLSEVLEEALVGPKKSGLISKLVALVPKITPDKPGPAAVPH